MGRHAESRAPANDPFMTLIVGALLLLLALIFLLAGM
jgi:uncharacterized integral membrane protein